MFNPPAKSPPQDSTRYYYSRGKEALFFSGTISPQIHCQKNSQKMNKHNSFENSSLKRKPNAIVLVHLWNKKGIAWIQTLVSLVHF
jgi:hypothetical protein